MSAQYKIESVLLGLRRLHGSHLDENIAEAVIAVVREFGIAENIGYMVLDNASSNDTCVSEILKELDIDDTKKRRRLRCLGHIINLSAKVFLFGINADAFEREVVNDEQINIEDENEREKEQEKRLKKWRVKGPIGKLHNVIIYIRNTPQRRQEFE